LRQKFDRPPVDPDFGLNRHERIVLDLAIDPEELKRLYRGTSRTVVARSRWSMDPVPGAGAAVTYWLTACTVRLLCTSPMDA
jgi:hypothetical protein